MTSQEIVAGISSIIVEQLGLGQDMEITAETSMIELGLDSIALMTLWVLVEEHFGFVADQDAVFNMVVDTIGDIAKYIATEVE